MELPTGTEFRPMQQQDVRAAVAIVYDHDEDDAAWAQQTYQQSLAGQFVLTHKGKVIGVSGAVPLEGTDRTWSISWTYLDRTLIGQGYGRALLDSVLNWIRSQGGRKVFVNTSNYVDETDGDVYRDAREAYRAAGFSEELRHDHYYDRNESMICFGMRLIPPGPTEDDANLGKIQLQDIDEIPECDGAYWLAWELRADETDAEGFQMIANQVKDWEGRVIFMAFPSDVVNASEFTRKMRFREAGRLTDYFGDGVDEVHYRYDLM